MQIQRSISVSFQFFRMSSWTVAIFGDWFDNLKFMFRTFRFNSSRIQNPCPFKRHNLLHRTRDPSLEVQSFYCLPIRVCFNTVNNVQTWTHVSPVRRFALSLFLQPSSCASTVPKHLQKGCVQACVSSSGSKFRFQITTQAGLPFTYEMIWKPCKAAEGWWSIHRRARH